MDDVPSIEIAEVGQACARIWGVMHDSWAAGDPIPPATEANTIEKYITRLPFAIGEYARTAVREATATSTRPRWRRGRCSAR